MLLGTSSRVARLVSNVSVKDSMLQPCGYMCEADEDSSVVEPGSDTSRNCC